MNATIVKVDSRSGDEILHSARNEYFAGLCLMRHAHTHSRRSARHFAIDDFALAGVKSGAYRHP